MTSFVFFMTITFFFGNKSMHFMGQIKYLPNELMGRGAISRFHLITILG